MVNDTGFIQLHRSLIDWEWYDDNNTFKLFIHCLLKANHKDKSWRGIDIKRGSFITSNDKLSKETGLSIQQVRTSLKKLKKTNEVTSKATSQNTVLTVVCYNKYQGKQQADNKRVTSRQQTSNKRVTTTNNDNNDNNDNNIYRSFDHLKITVDENNKLLLNYEQDKIDNILNSIENYKNNKNYRSLYLTCVNWLKREYPNYKKPKQVKKIYWDENGQEQTR